MNSIPEFLAVGEEVTDAEEGKLCFLLWCFRVHHSCSLESFLLFSQEIATGNLGFFDSRASTVEVAIRGNEYIIHQSPTLLSSSRAGGTTGAGM